MRKTLNKLGAPNFTVKNKYLLIIFSGNIQVKDNTKFMSQNEKKKKSTNYLFIFSLLQRPRHWYV